MVHPRPRLRRYLILFLGRPLSSQCRIKKVPAAIARATWRVTVAKISRRQRPEDCLRECGYGRSRCRHSDMQRRFSRSHNRRSTEPRQDCTALCSPWRCMAHSQSLDRIGPEVLLDRQPRVVLMAPSALEVPVVRDHLSDRVRLARKPRGR